LFKLFKNWTTIKTNIATLRLGFEKKIYVLKVEFQRFRNRFGGLLVAEVYALNLQIAASKTGRDWVRSNFYDKK
jgi:hypothetical protein